MNRTGNFIKIPNNVIIGEETLIKKFGDKALIVYIYLENHRTLRNNLYISISNCINECGYKPDSHKGKTNDQFRKILVGFKEEGIIGTDADLEKVKINDLIHCTMQEIDDKFFTIYDCELDKIIDQKKKEDKLNILKVFCIIKARIYKRNETESIYDGIFEVAFPSYKDIAYNCLISESNIKKYIDILVDLKLIKYDNLGKIVNRITGEIKECNNTYAIYNQNAENEIQGAIGLLKEKLKQQGYIIPRKEIKVDNRSLAGKKTQITKKIKNRIATEKDYKELEKINIQLKTNKE